MSQLYSVTWNTFRYIVATCCMLRQWSVLQCMFSLMYVASSHWEAPWFEVLFRSFKLNIQYWYLFLDPTIQHLIYSLGPTPMEICVEVASNCFRGVSYDSHHVYLDVCANAKVIRSCMYLVNDSNNDTKQSPWDDILITHEAVSVIYMLGEQFLISFPSCHFWFIPRRFWKSHGIV